MSLTRRSILGAAPALASTGLAAAALPVHPEAAAREVDDLVARATQAHTVLMRGEMEAYRSLIDLAADFVLMAPFGGKPTRAADLSDARWAAMGRFFRAGRESSLELLQAYHAPGLVVLAAIERAHVEVGGLPGQPWALRVTLVFRRDEGGRWLLAHRHADPLAAGISLEEAAAMARRPLPS